MMLCYQYVQRLPQRVQPAQCHPACACACVCVCVCHVTGTLTLNKMVIQDETPVFTKNMTQKELLQVSMFLWGRSDPCLASHFLLRGPVSAMATPCALVAMAASRRPWGSHTLVLVAMTMRWEYRGRDIRGMSVCVYVFVCFIRVQMAALAAAMTVRCEQGRDMRDMSVCVCVCMCLCVPYVYRWLPLLPSGRSPHVTPWTHLC